jgi:catechol 2,3-dioxygenase-like lactoylglutathione lyase family enzyme
MKPNEKRCPFSARGVGEVVLRVRDLDTMIGFYRDVLGLELLKRFDDGIAFMKVADGSGGHTQIVGFFKNELPSNFKRRAWSGHEPDRTTLHHFALEIPLEEYDSALAYFDTAGIEIDTAIHRWIGWRSIYVRDPEENTVELVCFDRAILEMPTP